MKDTQARDPRSRIPAVSKLIEQLTELFPEPPPHGLLTQMARLVAERLRAEPTLALDRQLLVEIAKPLLQPGPRPVINATGILLHTNLGRAPLDAELVHRAIEQVKGYTDLELDLEDGKRDHRDRHFAELARLVWQVEDATLVNNAAGALTLALAALGGGGETVVSRGEMIEIGGGFRLPEIMAIANSRLVEVGTTNKTRLADYEQALNPHTACLLKTHTSNYRIEGFTASVGLPELVALGRSHNLPVVMDLGSGLSAMIPFPKVDEPFIEDHLAAGPDLLIFSGDKLFGGVQAGIVLGKASAITRLRKHPMMRMLRMDKLGIALLCHQLRATALGRSHPFAALAGAVPDSLRARANQLAAELGPHWQVVDEIAYMGGGSLPQERRESVALRYSGANPQDLAQFLRNGDPSIVPYLRDGALWLNLAAVFPFDDVHIRDRLHQWTDKRQSL